MGSSNEVKRDGKLSHISKPFDFQSYFSNIASPSSTEKIKFNNSRARTHFIIGSAYKVCPRPKRSTKMLATTTGVMTSSKSSTCFICSQEFPFSELTAHEKVCLENMKSNNVSYTRQLNDDSSTSSFPLAYASNLSTHTSSSGESGSKPDKKYSRCYICGTDVPSYLASIHEKNCKKSWETGLLNSICTPARKSSSRGDLSKENSLSTPNLQKAKSANTLLDGTSKIDESKQKETKSARSSNSSSRNNSPKSKSKSTTNLTERTSARTTLNNSPPTTTKSTEDLRKSTEKLKKTDNPQYMICQTCGKLYSVHSISIHQRQCEKTYNQQKKVGTNVEYKVKSKSLADLTMNSKSPRRPQTASNIRPTTPKTASPRPASSNPINRRLPGKSLSSSTGNLSSPTYKRQLLKNLKNDNEGKSSNSPENTTTPENGKNTGLQKCYLCNQLYGTRSLPIHEKQCLKKWERNQAEEKKSRKEPVQKEIQIMAFGRSTFDDDSAKSPTNHRSSSTTPSQLFGIPSPLKKQEKRKNSKTLGDEITAELSIDFDSKSSSIARDRVDGPVKINHTPESVDTLTNDITSRSGSANRSKFVVCIYCYKQYGLHSIRIHEKNCRERKNVEAECKERLANNKQKMTNISLSKSVGNISSSSPSSSPSSQYTNGDMTVDLVKCGECQRKFLSSDIENHTRFCRVSIV